MGTTEGVPLPTSLAAVRPDLLAECDYKSSELDPVFFRPPVGQLTSNYPGILSRLCHCEPTLDFRRVSQCLCTNACRKCRGSLLACPHDR